MNRVTPDSHVLLSIIIPIYNNADCVEELSSRLWTVLSAEGIEEYEIIFVDDGSQDKSRELLRRLCAKEFRMKLIALTRNFGHQLAITAGFDYASGAAVLVMDGDLQDPPEVIPQFLAKWREGYDVVYGVRQSRLGESRFKRWTASLFYRTLRHLTTTAVALDSGDFRLLSRRATDTFNALRERHRFVRGMVSWLGYPQAPIYYHRAPRWAGESQYSLRKLIRLGLDGIFSFSDLPLRIATWLGLAGAGICLAYLAFALVLKAFWSVPVQGWVTLIAVIIFIGSVQLILLGVMGEYIGRIYEELKGRPLYVIEERAGFGDEERRAAL